MISYCRDCGVYATLDAAALCDRCRAAWQPAVPHPPTSAPAIRMRAPVSLASPLTCNYKDRVLRFRRSAHRASYALAKR